MESKELLYDHYKDTINIVKDEEVKRNKLFIIMIVHILILFLITMHPQGIFKTIDGLLVENLKVSLFFSINIIQIVAMFSMLYCSIRYYQININIDRMYTYIHKIEKEVAKNINKSIEREGMGYISNYPKTLDFIDYSYKYIFPVLFDLNPNHEIFKIKKRLSLKITLSTKKKFNTSTYAYFNNSSFKITSYNDISFFCS